MEELVLACRPVDIDDYPPERQEAFRSVPGWADTQIYPGSEIMQCEQCGIQIGVGPRQQKTRDSMAMFGPGVHVLCLIDAALYAHEHQGDTALANLGNPFKRAK